MMSTKGVLKVSPALISLLFLLNISVGFLGGWLGAKSFTHQGSGPDMNAQRQSIVDEGDVITEIASTVGESVVSINVISQSQQQSFFGPRSFSRASAGTGFILSKDGIVLTNRHVIPDGATEVTITLSDGTELEDVEVLGRTASSDPLDVAFLKINDAEGKDLKPVELGDSSDMKVGQKVIAIGNALGKFQNTVTTGIISGFGRNLSANDPSGTDALQNLFQTDAAINQGNSGGPLVNINGQVIGVNTAVAGGGAENIGFAIPIDDIKGLITGVLENGKFERPYLGVRYVQLNEEISVAFDLEVSNGAYIVEGSRGQTAIEEGSPADEAGIKVGDILTKVNGKEIDSRHTLVTLVGREKVGSKIDITLIRDGEEKTVIVTLRAAPQN